jgi:hypothetical protein
MAGNSSWYEHGYEGADREREKRELGTGPKRWWLTAGTSKQVVFIDDNPFSCHEHQWKTNDSKFPNFGTCIAQISQEICPACASKAVQKAEYTGHLTAVDIDGYVNKDGKEIKFELVEFCPKTKAMNKLKLKKQAKGSLIGQVCVVTRADKDSPNTGDDFEFKRDAKMAELYKVVTFRGKNLSEMITKANGHGDEAAKMRKFLMHHFQIPGDGPIPEEIPAFNYVKLHEPMEPAEFRKQVAGAVPYAGSNYGRGGNNTGSTGEATSDGDVPF